MNAFRERCIELRTAGHTLPEIIEITKRSKSSVYFHIAQIPLEKGRLEQIRLATGERARKIALARKGKSERNFKKFNGWDKYGVSLLSHLIFDGSITNSSCVYNNRNQKLLDRVEKCMSFIYDFKPKKWINPLTGVRRVSYHNVALAKYLKDKSVVLLKEIPSLSSPLKKEFVRAFFNDEGCIDYRPRRNRRQVRGYQKNLSILTTIQTLLKELGIESRVIMPNEVVISKKENLIKFKKEINFSLGVKINENRSNSIWRKSLEKSDLLEQAIASFKN